MYRIKFALLTSENFVSDTDVFDMAGVPQIGDTISIFGKYPKVSEVSWMTGESRVFDLVIFLIEE